jgi:hypothetical protein
MDSGIATLIGAVIAAGASITVAVIVARTPKREVHEVVLFYPTEPIKDSWFLKGLRAVGAVLTGLLVFIGINLLSFSALVWMGMNDPAEARYQRLIIAVLILSAVFLFGIARWVSNRIKQPSLEDEDD